MLATDHPPTISILIAARNEEKTILPCLQALTQLDYPADSIEVFVGDDQSADQTRVLVADFIACRPNFHLVTITEKLGDLAGKANVLAQLAQRAQGCFLFFTDADTQVPPEWVTEVVAQFTTNVGVVTGVTLPQGSRLFHKLQTIDWLYNLTLTHLLSQANVPITAMGNNMSVSRFAYNAVGGYPALPFSVTEDYTLFRAIINEKYGFRNLLTEQVLAWTKPVDTLAQWLNQRKRWMRGATNLPAWMVASLYVNYLAGPLLLLLGVFLPILAITLYLIRLFGQTLIVSFGLGRLRQTKLWPYALLFEIYQLIIGPLSVLFYWLPTRIDWKGRKYN